MSVKTWLIGAAAVVVLGGATVVVLGQKDGAQSGTTTKQTTAKSSTIIKPLEAAQSSKRQIWLEVAGSKTTPVVTKSAMVTGVLVTQNGQGTYYQLWSSKKSEPSVAEIDSLSDDELISKVKSENGAVVDGQLTANLYTDDTGNKVASEWLQLPFNKDGNDFESTTVKESGNFGTVLAHDYWGFVNDGGESGEDFHFLVQRVKPGTKGLVYSFDDSTTKGVTVDDGE